MDVFDLPQILRHNARFDLTKLQWLNGEYIRDLSADRFYELSVHALARAGIDTNPFPLAYVKAALDTCLGKVKLFSELPGYAGFYFVEEVSCDTEAAQKLFTPEAKPHLLKLRDALNQLTVFDAPTLETTLKDIARQLGIKPAALVHPVRLACTGKGAGPSLYHLLEVLGRTRVLQRLDRALTRVA
ncbi:MAG: hypothetical protein HYY24_06180 [Verrucomicrobia bacterium]|nr:hypothetical protein [Verrucomicrobiota bacterium]